MKKALSIALCLLLILGLAACSGGTGPASQPDDTPKEVAVLFPGDAGYFNAVKEGFDRAAAEFNIKVTYVDAGWDAATQVSQIEDAIQRKVDLIAVCCADALAFQDAVPTINEANIPDCLYKRYRNRSDRSVPGSCHLCRTKRDRYRPDRRRIRHATAG